MYIIEDKNIEILDIKFFVMALKFLLYYTQFLLNP